jgi:hypothetical protein
LVTAEQIQQHHHPFMWPQEGEQADLLVLNSSSDLRLPGPARAVKFRLPGASLFSTSVYSFFPIKV